MFPFILMCVNSAVTRYAEVERRR